MGLLTRFLGGYAGKLLIGGGLALAAWVGVKTGLGWIEDKARSHEQLQIENTDLKARAELLTRQKAKAEATTRDIERKVDTLRQLVKQYEDLPVDKETADWRTQPLPDNVHSRLQRLSEDLGKVRENADTEAPAAD